jgi:sigma-B regulation protein RsbU (phosphoserine phosphatase)
MAAREEPAAPASVLLIDDDPVVSRFASLLLAGQGYAVTCCADPAEGIARAQAEPPDVILLDIEMPGMNGMEACARLLGVAPHVPIMFFSAAAKERFIEQGFRTGAHDYLQKPFAEAELAARVGNLARLARHERSLRHTAEELRRTNQHLSRDLEAARRMQAALLPTSLAPDPAIACSVLYEPAAEIGGDLYAVERAPSGMIRILVADVSGHGVVAALLAAYFKMGYQVYSDREDGPAAVLQAIHGELCRTLDSGDFVTALAAWLDPVTGALRYASAGHAPCLWLRGGQSAPERLQPTGPVIGIVAESRFGESNLKLCPEDALLLLTDGVLEALGAAGEPYGLARVTALAAAERNASPSALLAKLRSDLRAFCRARPAEDDQTALVLKWRPGPRETSD